MRISSASIVESMIVYICPFFFTMNVLSTGTQRFNSQKSRVSTSWAHMSTPALPLLPKKPTLWDCFYESHFGVKIWALNSRLHITQCCLVDLVPPLTGFLAVRASYVCNNPRCFHPLSRATNIKVPQPAKQNQTFSGSCVNIEDTYNSGSWRLFCVFLRLPGLMIHLVFARNSRILFQLYTHNRMTQVFHNPTDTYIYTLQFCYPIRSVVVCFV